MEENRKTKEQKLTVGGFLFYNEKDARLAETEQKKIAYLEARMDYSKPEKIMQVYEKALEDRIFTTPVGLIYLKNIQDFLMEQEQIDHAAISPVPLFHTYDRELREQQQPARNRVQPAAGGKKKASPLPLSIILNVLLVLAVIAMFVITLQSDQPNILNYERTLKDRYASWEQELTQREETVREKEREWKIDFEK